ncbi:MAG: GDSL-type esterase/lipase family protein [Pirellulales bacterium]
MAWAVLSNMVVYHVASGQAFFSGAASILAAVALASFLRDGWLHRRRHVLLVLGVLLVGLSATPLPISAYVLLAAVSLAWLACDVAARLPGRWRKVSRAGMGVAWIAAVLVELPYHFMPAVVIRPPAGPQGAGTRNSEPVLGIIGDSVTAGMGADEAVTWPKLLANARGIPIRDHSRMGAKVASAREQAAALSAGESLVLLEIGGNDVLGSTRPAEFERGLEQLLNDVGRPGRTVIMFELPLPPLFNAYGLIQRRLARRHGVVLIPKRVLLGVLRRDGATLDSVHLSQAGHERMAELVWDVVRPAFE